jgi:integrase
MRGVSRRGNVLRVYVCVGTGPHRRQAETHFPIGTSADTIKRWRDKTREALRAKVPRSGDPGSMHADAQRYLPQVKAMPTYAQRRDHIEMWVKALGENTPRREVGAEQIRTILNRWMDEGIGPATCNKRRTALMHMWSTLDGKGAANAVRDVKKFRAPDALPRGHDPHVIDAALKQAPRCRSRAACRVLLWTGLRPIELDRAEPDDFNPTHHTLVVRTAKGGRVRVRPLSPQAVSALREFEDADGWHHVPMAAPLGRWLKKITGLNLRVYDLRHSYGTALARRQTRLDVIGSLLGHSTLELTKRYTLAAISPDAAQATLSLSKKLPATRQTFSQTKLVRSAPKRSRTTRTG